ncbi:DUF1499 domain-containing protein [Colwellia sp. MB02u-10]|uniref:DUF1499 domain-containing protein n=1 Tax=Colwellia sp. MB02u-10 TaxID=2759828 RepID=UPI0015F4ED27|nr:DUF1499 domain-containing protein [Colwellia sp. MB02u-10]MBA6339586.1 DUF1499 domain-containing protein [Colwellia sp. MB02u-10]
MNKLTQVVFTSFILLTGCAGKAPNLGIENGQLTQCPDKPNCVSSFSNNEKHYIKPIIIKDKRLEIKNDIVNIVNELKNSKVTVAENNYVRAEFTSKMFGFVDDVEFYFPETQSKDTSIHVRSGSRVGYSDFNVNRERIETIRLKFKTLNISGSDSM